MMIKLVQVRNQRKNMLNIRINQAYIPHIHMHATFNPLQHFPFHF